ncbi:stigma-specific STIG1-like protein 3 [Ziziphus jujuba]|uniref:Stigma-specific STIG1-like protein 3 n=2 Tax=Ziziphus jujuba TaxID=326968 RepID=A0A6P4ACT2_ZIZJJ|nr:stigma-specific STIG1-like protein 3 [Ziziphus jujuba]KAH7545706.1 hypothetical protein FEM48_Zijuj01G0122200 [Ziziphus jujuba var. spinosa]
MVKLLIKLFFTLLATASIVIFTASYDLDDHENGSDNTLLETQETSSSSTTSLRGVSRFLAQQNLAVNMTCEKFPRVCRLKNSNGPGCCKKKCVNVKTDRLNCGMCRNKCKYNEICCKGNCVNASFDRGNCGGCNNKCKKGEFCAYGMCNYG